MTQTSPGPVPAGVPGPGDPNEMREVTVHRREVIERLRVERRHAVAAFESERVAEIDAQIQEIEAAAQSVNPRRETTAAVARPKSRRKN